MVYKKLIRFAYISLVFFGILTCLGSCNSEKASLKLEIEHDLGIKLDSFDVEQVKKYREVSDVDISKPTVEFILLKGTENNFKYIVRKLPLIARTDTDKERISKRIWEVEPIYSKRFSREIPQWWPLFPPEIIYGNYYGNFDKVRYGINHLNGRIISFYDDGHIYIMIEYWS